MKDEQGTNIINPETMKIIRNLRQKGLMEKEDREYYINLMSESLSLKYGKGKSLMTLIEEHGQEWCISHGIIGYEYIASVSFTGAKNVHKPKPKDPPGIAGIEFNDDIYS